MSRYPPQLTNKTRTAESPDLVLSVADAKLIMREPCAGCTPETQDEIESTIRMVTRWIEEERGVTALPTTWEFEYSCWPCWNVFRIPHPPLVSVDSIVYFDADGNQQTLDTADYRVIDRPTNMNRWGTVESAKILGDDTFWPEIQADRADAITITAQAGFADPDSVDMLFRSAVGKLVTHDYRPGRDPYVERQFHEMPRSLESLLAMVGPHTTPGVVT
jgi:uncharacterized phiE125 gp8 family phage protein